jgi:arylsulfatase A-like enzyme
MAWTQPGGRQTDLERTNRFLYFGLATINEDIPIVKTTGTLRFSPFLIWASLLGALLDTGITGLRFPPHVPLETTWIVGIGNGCIVMAAMVALGGGGLWLLYRINDPRTVHAKLAQPVAFTLGLLIPLKKSPQERRDATVKFISNCVGLSIGLGVTFGVIYWVIWRFHEPLRMSALITMGCLATWWFVFNKLIPSLTSILFCTIGDGGRAASVAGQIGIIIILLGGVSTAVFLMVGYDEVFGALDVVPMVTILAFLLFASMGAHLSQKGIFRLLPTLTAATALVITGVVILSTLFRAQPESAVTFHNNGALGSLIYDFIRARLPQKDLSLEDAHPTSYTDPLDDPQVDLSQVVSPGGNILLVIMDAVRRDHLSLHGYGRNTSGALDRFAENATVFENFFAVANHTALAMPSLFTGLYPHTFPRIRQIKWHCFGIKKEFGALPNRLRKAGYQTVFFAGYNMKAFLQGWNPIYDPGKGVKGHEKAHRLVSRALPKLKEIGPNPTTPTIFGIHAIDAHHPYEAGDRPNRFGKDAEARYDGEIAHVNESLAPIFRLMETPGYADWLVIILSDHGEGFKEHGRSHHGIYLYDEEIRVPAILRVPGTRSARTTLAANHLDILPTILGWVGLPEVDHLPGRSLLPVIVAPKQFAHKRRVVFQESFRTGDQFNAHDGRFSMIYRPEADTLELYDTHRDPTQKKNLVGNTRDAQLRWALMFHSTGALSAMDAGQK